jgi:hypothetical protein
MWPFKKKNISETFISFELGEEGSVLVKIGCEEEDKETFSQLIYLLSSGGMLSAMIETLKTTLGKDNKLYEEILQNVTLLYKEDAIEKEIDFDEVLISPSEVFSRERDDE